MNIALPESLEPLVMRRVEEGGYASAEDYVRDLILADGETTPEWQRLTDEGRREVERVNKMLLQSLDSGPPVVADEAYWDDLKRRARERRTDGA